MYQWFCFGKGWKEKILVVSVETVLLHHHVKIGNLLRDTLVLSCPVELGAKERDTTTHEKRYQFSASSRSKIERTKPNSFFYFQRALISPNQFKQLHTQEIHFTGNIDSNV